jgi:DNA polymerase delta subunit 1
MKRSKSDTAAKGTNNTNSSNNPPQKRAKYVEDFDAENFADEEVDFGDNYYEQIEIVEGEEGGGTEGQQQGKWIRPRNVPLDPSTEDLTFQWLDIDMYSGPPLPSNPAGGPRVGGNDRIMPIVRLYGVTNEGNSVMANIHGFTPYFYASFVNMTDFSDRMLGEIRVALDTKVIYLIIILN